MEVWDSQQPTESTDTSLVEKLVEMVEITQEVIFLLSMEQTFDNDSDTDKDLDKEDDEAELKNEVDWIQEKAVDY